MKEYIVFVTGIKDPDDPEGGNRKLVFDDEKQARREAMWYATYSTAETVELVTREVYK